VVGLNIDETIRSYLDLERREPNTKYYAEAVKYYQVISSKAVNAGHGVDIFGCALDQTGLYEMKVLPERTGGNLVMTDTFSAATFKASLVKMLTSGDSNPEGGLSGGFNGKFEVVVSKDLKVCGGIGPMTSLSKRIGSSVSDTEIGEAGTTVWASPVMNGKTSFAVYFEPVGLGSGSGGGAVAGGSATGGGACYVQFLTYYTSGIGQRHLRVCTLAIRYADTGMNLASLAAGFDQETAVALMARYAVVKKETEEAVDVQRWIDRMLIRLVSRFADYRKDEPTSFHLSPEFTFYPVFMYHLRRGLFLNSFNASPDETAFYRSWLLREDVKNTMTMIQPTLKQWDLEHEHGYPALLDATSLQPGSILVMDDYFMVLIWRGESIHNWIQQGYHLQEEYVHLRNIAESAEIHAKSLIDGRFPIPRFINCNQGGSQARFLTARVNPSVTHNTQPGMAQGPISESSVVFSDDASLKVFMDHLIKLAVQA
jgi:protein transport protein SEC23